MRYGTVFFGVYIYVGIEQIQRYSSYVGTPDMCVNHSVGERHGDDYSIIVFVFYLTYTEFIEILCFVIGYLLPIDR